MQKHLMRALHERGPSMLTRCRRTLTRVVYDKRLTCLHVHY